MPEKECRSDKRAGCILVDNGHLHYSLHSQVLLQGYNNGHTAVVRLACMLSTLPSRP